MKDEVLSIEQMKRLQELGINIEVDARYLNWGKWVDGPVLSLGVTGLPVCRAFTLLDLLEMMPPRLKEKYVFHIHKVGDHYHLEYSYPGCDATLHSSYSRNLLDAAYDMYLWYLADYKTSKH